MKIYLKLKVSKMKLIDKFENKSSLVFKLLYVFPPFFLVIFCVVSLAIHQDILIVLGYLFGALAVSAFAFAPFLAIYYGIVVCINKLINYYKEVAKLKIVIYVIVDALLIINSILFVISFDKELTDLSNIAFVLFILFDLIFILMSILFFRKKAEIKNEEKVLN